jgi:hypothetical protein
MLQICHAPQGFNSTWLLLATVKAGPINQAELSSCSHAGGIAAPAFLAVIFGIFLSF